MIYCKCKKKIHYLEYFLNRYFFLSENMFMHSLCIFAFIRKLIWPFVFILNFNDATFLDKTRHVNDIYSLSKKVDGIMTSFRCILSVHNRPRATNVLKSQLKTYPQVLHFRLWWDFAKTVCATNISQIKLTWAEIWNNLGFFWSVASGLRTIIIIFA